MSRTEIWQPTAQFVNRMQKKFFLRSLDDIKIKIYVNFIKIDLDEKRHFSGIEE